VRFFAGKEKFQARTLETAQREIRRKESWQVGIQERIVIFLSKNLIFI